MVKAILTKAIDSVDMELVISSPYKLTCSTSACWRVLVIT